MAKKKAYSKKKAVGKKKVVGKKKSVSKKKVATKKAKPAVDRRQVNIMMDEKSIKKLDKVRGKHGATRSEMIMKMIKSAS